MVILRAEYRIPKSIQHFPDDFSQISNSRIDALIRVDYFYAVDYFDND
jgi:hypothetical protein